MSKGKISILKLYEVACANGCGYGETITQVTSKKEAEKELKTIGYEKKNGLWICPRCK